MKSIGYILRNYLAYGLNFLSGLILARKLGPHGRGNLAFLSSFFYITLLIAPLNLRNASSLAQILQKETKKNIFGKRQLIIISLLLTFSLTLLYLIFIHDNFETIVLICFSVANMSCFLTSFIYIHEGIYRVEGSLSQLGTLRFLGLALPSFYVFFLLAIGKVEIKYLILSQFVAVMGCFCYILFNKRDLTIFSFDEIIKFSLKSYPSHILEYVANYMILLTVNFSQSPEDIGHFVIAYGFTLIAETPYSIVESDLYKKSQKSINRLVVNQKKILLNCIAKLSLIQFPFLPAALLIPMIYGDEYSSSSWIAIVLIVARFFYSIVKLANIQGMINNSNFTNSAVINFGYILAYSIFLAIFSILFESNAWIPACILSSSFVCLLTLVNMGINSKRFIELNS